MRPCRFNPRPARRPGAAGCEAAGRVGLGRSFNPRPARRPGAAPPRQGAVPCRGGFNPRPARRPGAALAAHVRVGDGGHVSILARPEGRALPGRPRARLQPTPRFNPRPARRPGAARCRSPRSPGSGACFNPRPARRPGAASKRSSMSLLTVVFQSSPGPKAGRCLADLCYLRCEALRVSILARPEGRALPGSSAASAAPSGTFQSSPGPKAGRCRGGTLRSAAPDTFQSSPGPKAGRCGPLADVDLRDRRVSILARPEGRALRPQVVDLEGAAPVSILARPEGRALQRSRWLVAWTQLEFQSSPGPKAGRCVEGLLRGSTMATRFQSSPGPKAGRCIHPHDLVALVEHVSILARPEGRALPSCVMAQRTQSLAFQSSPGPKAGRCRVRRSGGPRRRRFNPRPARRPGAAGSGDREVLAVGVSILARPEGRALRSRCTSSTTTTRCFNPRPARRPGAARTSRCGAGRRPRSFNPRPARRPGAAGGVGVRSADRTLCFNPRPARRPGAARPQPKPHRGPPRVSILARPEGRALRPAPRIPGRRPRCFNPRPARRPGAAAASRFVHRLRGTCFNPRPARRPGAARGRGGRGVAHGVSILARPEGRALLGGMDRRFSHRDTVSILARPEGRALPGAGAVHT